MPSVVMLSVIMLSVVMLSVIMLSVVMLSVVMLSVVMLSIQRQRLKLNESDFQASDHHLPATSVRSRRSPRLELNDGQSVNVFRCCKNVKSAVI